MNGKTSDNGLAEQSDESLMAQVKGGSKAAYTVLVERYMHRAYTIAYRVVGNADDARDLSQDVFLKIYESSDRYREGYRFFSWFYRILLNHCLNHNRRRAWIVRSGDDDRYAQSEPVAEPGIAERGDVILQQYVQKAIASLPVRQRAVILLCDLEGMRQTEAAEILKVSEGTVRSRLHYGRKKLKVILKPFFDEVST
ncbi:MAG: RNA polymerase sigma factor [Proteobacteria bacterium]|nr:RNA polymerase sigma factor [Pseudomonadota bacterium]